MKKLILTFALLLLLPTFFISAQNNQNEQTIATLRRTLANATTSKDSIKILYDIFDLSDRKHQPEVGHQIYAIAERIGDNSTRLDILRLLTACFKEDRVFEQLQKEARRVPASEAQRETEMFINMKRLTYTSRHKNEADRQKELINILAHWDKTTDKNNKPKTERQKFLDLFTVVEYLRNEATGDMLKEYLDKLIAISNSSNFEIHAIRNLIYSEASNIYSDAGDSHRAIESDRKLLDVIDALEKKYKSDDRRYRNYDISRYVVYRRMLRNFKDLTPAEIEDVYQKIKKLGESNAEVKEDITNNPGCMAYYHMATGNYNEAIPLLKAMLQNNDLATQVRKQALEHLITAADQVGDDKTKIDALTQYNIILEELNKTQAADKYKELQIKYDVQDLKSRNASLELDNRDQELESSRQMMTLLTSAFLIMAVILLILLWNWRRYKLNAQRMGNIVDKIHRERKMLRDKIYSDYADESSDGNDDDDVKDWKQRMKELSLKNKDASIFMTDSITSDVLYISSIGLDDSLKFIHEVSVDSLMRSVERRVAEHHGEKNNILIEYPDDDISIETDSECLIHILSHGLNVATDYYPDKTVSLSVTELDKDHIGFYFTIDGVRMASSLDPQLFSRPKEAESMLGRKNGGMFFCRMILLQLNCLRIPDNSYKKGTRYLLRVPKVLRVG